MTTTAAKTVTGIKVTDQVTYTESGITSTHTVLAVSDMGLRCDIGIGYDVDVYSCQLLAQPTPDSDRFPTVGHRVTRRAGNAVITIQRTEFAYTVTTERGGFRVDDNSGSYPTEAEAVLIAEGYRRMYRAEGDMPAVLKSTRPVAKGHQTDMSASQGYAIRFAVAYQDGKIGRGNQNPGSLNSAQLTAAAKRGWVTLTYLTVGRRRIINGGVVTEAGKRRAEEINPAQIAA